MEIRPILSAMWRSRTGSVLVALQIALTLAIVVNSLFLAKTRLDMINRPSGIDIENIIEASSIGFGNAYEHDATIENDLRLLRALPGVTAASSASHVPMSNSGNGSGFRASADEDATSETANVFLFDEKFQDALGVKFAAGRGFLETEVRRSDDARADDMAPHAIITQALADKLYPDEPALGKLVYNNLGESATIVGVIELMHGSWVQWDGLEKVIVFPQRTSEPYVRYLVRTAPGERDALIPIVEKTLADANRNRLVRNVRAFSETVARSYTGENAVAKVLITAIILLLTVTGLGIVGLASFSVRQRTKQIGTRRAIGARKRDIIRYFVLENWLMTTMGIVLGTILTIAVNYALSNMFDMERLNYWYLPLGAALLWLLGFIAVMGPSRRASNISPAVATRTV